MKLFNREINFKEFTVKLLPGQEQSIFGGRSYSGAQVDEYTALNYSVVWACVKLLSETLASLPFITYERLTQGKQRATNHPLYYLLHDSPNEEMSSFNFFESLMSHLLLWGNAFALIGWDSSRTEIQSLVLMRPDRVTVQRDLETKQLIYKYAPIDNTGTISLPAWRVWHIPGLGFDGLTGYSVINYARESIGLGMVTQEFGARFFGRGTNTGAVVQHPKTLSKVAHDNLRGDLKEKYEGLDKSHTLMLLEEGMTFQRTTIPPNDSQFLETRQFQLSDVARWFHVQPHMIGDLTRSTNNNIEQQSLEFVIYTMRPWLVRVEKSAKLKLFLPNERNKYFSEFLVDALLRGDFESRTRGYWQSIQGGWMSPNEIRELENKNPRPNGDEYLQPVNMIVSGQQIPANNNKPIGG